MTFSLCKSKNNISRRITNSKGSKIKQMSSKNENPEWFSYIHIDFFCYLKYLVINQCKLMFSQKYCLWTPFVTKCSECDLVIGRNQAKKSRIRETKNVSTDADSSTNIFVSAGVKKGADSIFFWRRRRSHRCRGRGTRGFLAKKN